MALACVTRQIETSDRDKWWLVRELPRKTAMSRSPLPPRADAAVPHLNDEHSKIFHSYFGDTQMANAPLSAASNAAAAAATRQIVLKEVGAMWGKFSERELSGLEGDA